MVDVVTDEGTALSGNVAGHGTLWHKKSHLCDLSQRCLQNGAIGPARTWFVAYRSKSKARSSLSSN